jgi:predicted nucleic acid-binding protein
VAYEEVFTDLLRADREEKTNPRYTFVVKGHFSRARSGAPGIRADLKRLGSAVEAKIVANDLFIAAHARSLGLTLVTNNTREFGRVSRLVIENWTFGS